MHTIRRIYLYAVVFISLETVLWGAINLARVLLGGEASGGEPGLARPISLILVGLPIFLVHGTIAERLAVKDPQERAARTRAVFLYGTLFVTLIPIVQNTLALINRAWLAIFGLQAGQAFIGGEQTWSDNLAAILFNAAAAAFILAVLRRDWRALGQSENHIRVRRVHRYLWVVYSLAVMVAGFQQILQFLLEFWQSAGQSPGPELANSLALLIVGLPLWWFVDNRVKAALEEPAESASTLRLVVLYALSLAGLAGMLAAVAAIIAVVLRAALGDRMTVAVYLAEISRPVSLAIPLGAVWVYYGRQLQRTILSATPLRSSLIRQAGLRRVYFYSLALLGLAAAFAGLYDFLGLALTAAIGQSRLALIDDRQGLATALALLLVGIPVWLANWRPMAREAAQENEAGDHARRSAVRKAYLFLILFLGMVGIMVSAAGLIFGLLSSAFGEPPENLGLEAVLSVRGLLLYILLVGGHAWALRSDTRRAQRSLIHRHAQFPVLLLAPEDEAFTRRMLDALERAAPGLPVAIHPYSQGAPDELLSAARAVIVPGEVLARPAESVRLWLQGFRGTRVVVPTPVRDWQWVLGSNRSLQNQARQTAALVRRLAEGDEIAEGGSPA
jgi:hypothetical protein